MYLDPFMVQLLFQAVWPAVCAAALRHTSFHGLVKKNASMQIIAKIKLIGMAAIIYWPPIKWSIR